MSYLEHVELSPAQLEVLIEAAPRGLVAAGAGSGKTRLLVAYFVHALVDGGVPLQNLAAVTFTRKAGSELAERIRRELISCGRPDLARGVDGAAIGTIHGLCSRLLRERPLEAGVDPSFTVLEPDAGSLIKEEISKQAWSLVVEEAAESELEALASWRERLEKADARALRTAAEHGPGDTPTPHRARSRRKRGTRGARFRSAPTPWPRRGAYPSAARRSRSDLERIGRCVQWLERTAAGGERRTVAATNGFFPSKTDPFCRAMAGSRQGRADSVSLRSCRGGTSPGSWPSPTGCSRCSMKSTPGTRSPAASWTLPTWSCGPEPCWSLRPLPLRPRRSSARPSSRTS